MTASQRRTVERTAGVLCLSLIVGLAITSEHDAHAKLARRLKQSGRSTQAIVVRKQATASGQGRDFCYITYQFQARQVPAPTAPEVTFHNEVEVPDHFFDSITEGQSVAVVYDPRDPSTSILEASMHFPRSQAWPVWTWWIGCSVALALLFRSYFVQARFTSKGTLIRGTIVSLSMQGKSEHSFVDIRYVFDSPVGRSLEGNVRKEAKLTTYPGVTPPLVANDAVAVLYLTDKDFLLL